MKNVNLTAEPWEDYELLDSGDNKKLERYGKYLMVRPETQAIWKPGRPEEWKKAQAEFSWNGGKGAWKVKDIPDSWKMSWRDAKFTARLTSFKHTGIFPEQSVNWEWIEGTVKKIENPKILNLFGYTGVASIIAAKAGGKVTHVDASKQSNAWAKENADMSGIPEGAVRYLLDDALRFSEREVRRGNIYNGIILDPPSFGRGPEGEIWRIEEHIRPLMKVLSLMLSKEKGSFLLLNGYAAGYSPQSFLQAVEDFFPEDELTDGSFGEVRLKETKGKRLVSSGIYVRFQR